MSAQLFRNDVLAQFLAQAVIVILGYLNDAVDISVDVLLEHILYLHGFFPPSKKIKSPVIVTVQKFIKENERLTVEATRIEHYNRDVLEEMLHTV